MLSCFFGNCGKIFKSFARIHVQFTHGFPGWTEEKSHDIIVKRGDSMRDIPMFTTENGAASLILREIPYRGEAYIRIQDTACPEELMEECVSFCRIVGADKIYATGHEYLQKFPLHTKVLQMVRSMDALPETDAMTMPITAETLEQWRQIYNDAMKPIDNASYMDTRQAQKLLQEGNGYFVHRNGDLLGIGIASDGMIHAVVSVKPGAGRDVLLALTHALFGETVTLEVASTNTRAIRLYECLGFIKTAENSSWYSVI